MSFIAPIFLGIIVVVYAIIFVRDGQTKSSKPIGPCPNCVTQIPRCPVIRISNITFYKTVQVGHVHPL